MIAYKEMSFFGGNELKNAHENQYPAALMPLILNHNIPLYFTFKFHLLTKIVPIIKTYKLPIPKFMAQLLFILF